MNVNRINVRLNPFKYFGLYIHVCTYIYTHTHAFQCSYKRVSGHSSAGSLLSLCALHPHWTEVATACYRMLVESQTCRSPIANYSIYNSKLSLAINNAGQISGPLSVLPVPVCAAAGGQTLLFISHDHSLG